MITHGNMVATTAAVMTIIPKLGTGDVYLAYLPLAHVFELAAEVTSFAIERDAIIKNCEYFYDILLFCLARLSC